MLHVLRTLTTRRKVVRNSKVLYSNTRISIISNPSRNPKYHSEARRITDDEMELYIYIYNLLYEASNQSARSADLACFRFFRRCGGAMLEPSRCGCVSAFAASAATATHSISHCFVFGRMMPPDDGPGITRPETREGPDVLVKILH